MQEEDFSESCSNKKVMLLCRSRRFPGEYYWFNTANGEAIWCRNEDKSSSGRPCDTDYPEPSSPPHICNGHLHRRAARPNVSTFGTSIFPSYLPQSENSPSCTNCQLPMWTLPNQKGFLGPAVQMFMPAYPTTVTRQSRDTQTPSGNSPFCPEYMQMPTLRSCSISGTGNLGHDPFSPSTQDQDGGQMELERTPLTRKRAFSEGSGICKDGPQAKSTCRQSMGAKELCGIGGGMGHTDQEAPTVANLDLRSIILARRRKSTQVLQQKEATNTWRDHKRPLTPSKEPTRRKRVTFDVDTRFSPDASVSGGAFHEDRVATHTCQTMTGQAMHSECNTAKLRSLSSAPVVYGAATFRSPSDAQVVYSTTIEENPHESVTVVYNPDKLRSPPPLPVTFNKANLKSPLAKPSAFNTAEVQPTHTTQNMHSIAKAGGPSGAKVSFKTAKLRSPRLTQVGYSPAKLKSPASDTIESKRPPVAQPLYDTKKSDNPTQTGYNTAELRSSASTAVYNTTKFRRLTSMLAGECWYIAADLDVLLNEFGFVEDLVQSDNHCRLLLPAVVRSCLDRLCRQLCVGARQSRVLAARQLSRRLATATYVVEDKTAGPFDEAESFIDCCKRYNAILVTNRPAFHTKATAVMLTCLTVYKAKRSVTEVAPIHFDVEKVQIQEDIDLTNEIPANKGQKAPSMDTTLKGPAKSPPALRNGTNEINLCSQNKAPAYTGQKTPNVDTTFKGTAKSPPALRNGKDERNLCSQNEVPAYKGPKTSSMNTTFIRTAKSPPALRNGTNERNLCSQSEVPAYKGPKTPSMNTTFIRTAKSPPALRNGTHERNLCSQNEVPAYKGLKTPGLDTTFKGAAKSTPALRNGTNERNLCSQSEVPAYKGPKTPGLDTTFIGPAKSTPALRNGTNERNLCSQNEVPAYKGLKTPGLDTTFKGAAKSTPALRNGTNEINLCSQSEVPAYKGPKTPSMNTTFISTAKSLPALRNDTNERNLCSQNEVPAYKDPKTPNMDSTFKRPSQSPPGLRNGTNKKYLFSQNEVPAYPVQKTPNKHTTFIGPAKSTPVLRNGINTAYQNISSRLTCSSNTTEQSSDTIFGIQELDSREKSPILGQKPKRVQVRSHNGGGVLQEFENALREFAGPDSGIEDKFVTRKDEWLCRFVQILEEAFTSVILSPTPLLLDEALNSVKQLHSDIGTLNVACTEVAKLFVTPTQQGEFLQIRRDVDSKQLMRILGSGVILLKSLMQLHPANEALSAADSQLRQLLADCRDAGSTPDESMSGCEGSGPYSDVGEHVGVRHHRTKRPTEVMEYLKRHSRFWGRDPSSNPNHAGAGAKDTGRNVELDKKPVPSRVKLVRTGADIGRVALRARSITPQPPEDGQRDKPQPTEVTRALTPFVNSFLGHVGGFLTRVLTVLKSMQAEFQNGVLGKDRRRVIRRKVKKVRRAIEGIRDELRRIVEREGSEIGSSLRMMITRADVASNIKMRRYRQVVMKLLEQVDILDRALQIVDKMASGASVEAQPLEPLCDIKYINIFDVLSNE